jgi:UDP-N-acetylglucosamine 2-epimerase (non-hydrolysing)
MKVMTILGTRPEIIRLSYIIELLDNSTEHHVVHTGQNYDERLDGLFFRDLGVREPDSRLNARGSSFGELAGQILAGVEELLHKVRPDRVLILGDTNSGLSAIVARRLGIPVFHMEAGNRCYDDRVPEEVNRRIIDHSSTVLLPYTERSRQNLLREGFAAPRVFVTGNPIKQVIDRFASCIDPEGALRRYGVGSRRFFLVTAHRAENVDREHRLRDIIGALRRLSAGYGMPVVCSFHPRTRAKAQAFGVDVTGDGLHFVEPIGFFDFLALEREAFCVLSDSGTVQEETCLFRTPNVTIREVTERPETVECGSNFLAGTSPQSIVDAVALVTRDRCGWSPPPEYLVTNVAETVCRIVTGYHLPDAAELEWRAANAAPTS